MVKVFKQLVALLLLLFTISVVSATTPIVNINISENAFEEVMYNPLKPGSGLYVDANENQSVYSLNGTLTVSNIHANEPLFDLTLNITNISNIYNASFIQNTSGYVQEFNTAQDFMILYIPALDVGDNITLRYDINISNVAPPLNLTAEYENTRTFAGDPMLIINHLTNELSPLNHTDACIYDLNITETARTITAITGDSFDIVFNGSTLAGTDAGNASIFNANRTLEWNVSGFGCFGPNNYTNISYDIITPWNLTVRDHYQVVNATISYRLNTSLSQIKLADVDAVLDLELQFEKFLNNTLTGENGTWRISSDIGNPTDVDINLTQVSFWVSKRNATGSGFTDPSVLDNDSITGVPLTYDYFPNILLNGTNTPWQNNNTEWYFNYSFMSSPIVWLDAKNEVIVGNQIFNQSVTYANNNIYVKELYLVTGYWLEVTKNITNLGDGSFNVNITVTNRGNSPTPLNQIVQVYQFLSNDFALNGTFEFSNSPWYNSSFANETLNDAIYNGTMYQFAIMYDNYLNSSLDSYKGGPNENNTWNVIFNVTGYGEFEFDDLFITGVDPLQVNEYGATQAIVSQGAFDFSLPSFEFGFIAAAVALLLFILVI